MATHSVIHFPKQSKPTRKKKKAQKCAVVLEPFPSHKDKAADMPRRVDNCLPDDLLLGLTDFLKRDCGMCDTLARRRSGEIKAEFPREVTIYRPEGP